MKKSIYFFLALILLWRLQTILSGENEVVGRQSFPLSSFTFIDSKQGRGVIDIGPQKPS